jgi:hypothetical protein
VALRVRAGPKPRYPSPRPLRIQMAEGRKEQVLQIERMPDQTPERTKPPMTLASWPQWLVVRDEAGRWDPLCVEDEGGRVLPVFSHKEEAELFLYLAGYDGGWRVRESSAGEVVSVLYGLCADVNSVALDLLPGMIDDGTLRLIKLGRERFLERLLGPSG